MPAAPFALVLAIWGSKYDARHVNEIAERAFALSPGLAAAALQAASRRIAAGAPPAESDISGRK